MVFGERCWEFVLREQVSLAVHQTCGWMEKDLKFLCPGLMKRITCKIFFFILSFYSGYSTKLIEKVAGVGGVNATIVWKKTMSLH